MAETPFKPTYAQLLETNHLIQTCADETYWLCLTRTVQESKLFPVPAYMMLSYLMAFYRYPPLLRKIEQNMSAEEIADRMRRMSMKVQNPAMGWALPGLYLLGREWLINLGLLRPTDAIEDLVYVMDFWKRYELSWHRETGHFTNKDAGHRAQILPERQIQVFHADIYTCEAGDDLHTAATAFMASASQYGFLISCESRISLNNTGPYKLADGVEMLVRDFMDLSESDFPWLDDVAASVPHNNLTVPMTVKDVHFYLMDDWGSFESQPDFKNEQVVGVGLYESDNLSGGYRPVAMDSREELITKFTELDQQVRNATNALWKRIAGWTRDQMIDAGAITYFAMIKDLAHIAGVYDVGDWMKIDVRAERFRPLFNDEYSRDVLAELVGYLSLPSQQLHEYAMAQHADAPVRMFSHIPYSVLSGEGYTSRSGGVAEGISYLPPKKDLYTTTMGRLPLNEFNRLSREAADEPSFHEYRFLSDSWVKYNAGTPLADALYVQTQSRSRNLAGAGSMVRRRDISGDAGGGSEEHMHNVLHALAIRKAADAVGVSELAGVGVEETKILLEKAVELGRAGQVGEKFMLTAPGQMILRADYDRIHAHLRREGPLMDQYDRFERINAELKQLITDWQTIEVGGDRLPNDHADKEYDARIIDRLGALHERFEPLLGAMARELPRLSIYSSLLLSALERAEDGEFAWVSDAQIPSYHTVWFEMHEDLLRVLGRVRDE